MDDTDHPNVSGVREALDAYEAEDWDRMRQYLDEDILWHVGGDHPHSGTYRGRDTVIGYFQEAKQLTGGTLRLDIDEILTNDEFSGVVLRATGERAGKHLNVQMSEVIRFGEGGRWAEFLGTLRRPAGRRRLLEVTVMHPNAERVVQGMANFSTGNHEALKDVFAEDAEWIFGGRSRFAGRYKGRDEVLRWLRDIQTATGTEVKPLSILGSDRHVIVLNDLTSGRGERRSRTTEAFCCVMNDRGQIQKFYQLNADQDAYDTSIAGL